VRIAVASASVLLAENSAVKDNGSPALWFALTVFAIALALAAGVLAYLARKANKDDRYRAWKRAATGLLTMALLSFLRALLLSH
jgi:Na+-driven multidrug efflux pump